ncbi:MAG: 16S rRNA (uracil(1498)-N(3))-methyltransferase [Prevotella sp.]|jgi:16S rRNA (uracil1498-N3)-methyltransferase|nr:16S rRNA (uracil(1498)-N(3))-methyltransferase [Prevotella sp.]
MKEARYFYCPEADETNLLPQEEATHALRVLRLQSGDELFLIDGKGNFYRAEVALATNKRLTYNILETMPQQKTWHGDIHLAIAPTKNMDRIEWMTEKITEIGFDHLSFLECKFSERKQIRIDRVDKIVVSAVKQSRKPWKPLVDEMISFKQFIDANKGKHGYIAHCYNEFPKKDLFSELQTIDRNEEVIVMVGPEGDFSVDEVKYALDNGFESISLGESRLRTETAGLMAVTMAQLIKRR